MQENVVVQGGLAAMLADVVAGEFDGALVKPFINDVDPGKIGTTGDFDPSTYVTSTAVAITWGDPYLNASGDYEVSSQLIEFPYVSGGPETVYGVTVKSAAGGNPLLLYGRLDEPKEMAVVGDTIQVVVRLTMSSLGFGASVQVSQ